MLVEGLTKVVTRRTCSLDTKNPQVSFLPPSFFMGNIALRSPLFLLVEGRVLEYGARLIYTSREVMFVGLVVGSLNRRWGEMGLGSTREPFCFGSLVGLCTDRPSDAYLNHRIFGEAVAIPFQTEEMMSATQLSGVYPRSMI